MIQVGLVLVGLFLGASQTPAAEITINEAEEEFFVAGLRLLQSIVPGQIELKENCAFYLTEHVMPQKMSLESRQFSCVMICQHTLE